MTEHPDELLAAYVDGDLDAADRRVVRAHVRSCPSCREEVRLAGIARDALASLPEEPAPEGTAFRVLRQTPAGQPASGRVWRIATAAGIAASLVLGAVVVLQRIDLGGGAEQAQSADAGASRPNAEGQAEDAAEGVPAPQSAGTEEALLPGLPRLLSRRARYESADMPGVLRRLEREATMLVANQGRMTGESFQSELDGDNRGAAAAIECASSAIRAATDIEDPGVPFVFEKAAFFDTFAGEYVPGYVAAYLDAPSPDAEPTSLFMTVVDRETCDRLLYFTPPVEL